jgi:hypothetical protein
VILMDILLKRWLTGSKAEKSALLRCRTVELGCWTSWLGSQTAWLGWRTGRLDEISAKLGDWTVLLGTRTVLLTFKIIGVVVLTSPVMNATVWLGISTRRLVCKTTRLENPNWLAVAVRDPDDGRRHLLGEGF